MNLIYLRGRAEARTTPEVVAEYGDVFVPIKAKDLLKLLDLAEAAKNVVPTCHQMRHSKKHRHMNTAACPVVEEFEAAIKRIGED